MPSKPPTFRPRHQPSAHEQARAYDERRGSARQRGYTARWDKAARAYRMVHPLCVGCRAVGRVTQADVVDHIVPHGGDHGRMWSPDNWQSACAWHHDVVKQRLELLLAQGKATALDMRLESALAQRLTREATPGGVC